MPPSTSPRDLIVTRLLDAGATGDAVSGETLARELGMSRAAVGKHVRTLRDEGYTIGSTPGKGYTLRKVPDVPYPRELMRGLEDFRNIPSAAYYHPSLPSTNAEARRMAESDPELPDGAVVIAGTQKTGRGRLGRSWASPKGGIWLSVVLRPPVPPAEVHKLVLLTGNAVCAALKFEANVECGLKWPNDVLVRERKVCGILAEASMELDRVHYVVMGVGLNYDFPLSRLPKDVREGATTVKALVDRPLPRVPMVRRLLRELDDRYAAFCSGDTSSVIAEWKERTVTLGRKVEVQTPGGEVKGVAADMDEAGRLVVRTREGDVAVSAGDCRHLR